ncbi:MAG: HNH endonuclease signature motif containing protein [Hyphomonas sp.]
MAMPASRFDLAHATLWKKQRPTFDHIRPKAAGGSEAWSNLQLAHAVCNWRKGSCG